ncbi:MAG: hypothetical protein HQ567_12870 [Candidatus Nealsonbacteria bacterium]|nr:hypothetical protein [Candidatus Nealsonbacteria bacterium]
MAFVLPFETELAALDEQLKGLDQSDPSYSDVLARLVACEREVYRNLSAYDTYLLSGHPLRPKTLDYVWHIFHEVTLFRRPNTREDHLLVVGEGKIEIDGRPIDVMIVGQQTGPSSQLEELIRLPASEYQRWNQGMGFPDGYRKAVYAMDLAEQRGWPVVVFVDTPGADPTEYSEEQGQAFAINEVIHKTTSLKTPNLSYIISKGASGGAIALTPTNRTIINQHATYMVISPGGCASILFRNRSPESIRKAADGLRLTSADALEQGTVDEVIEEGAHPGHRYPNELLAKAKEAVSRNLAQILDLHGEQAERQRRAKFFAMGVWGESANQRQPDTLANQARKQNEAFGDVRDALAEYVVDRAGTNGQPADEEVRRPEVEEVRRPEVEAAAEQQSVARKQVARIIYAVDRNDAEYVHEILGVDAASLSKTQWDEIYEYLLKRRYGHRDGHELLNPNGRTYRRLHPVCWIRRLADEGSFREFAKTINYCSIGQFEFPGYEEALLRGIEETGLNTGLVTGVAKIGGFDTVLAVNNFGLVGSSLCDEIGEKLRYAAAQALRSKTPMISVAMGGGARMQEGTPSMHRNIPKIHHALNELQENGVPHISVVCDPTLGGTAISYGLRGDRLIVVQGSANIGFSGRRVIEQFQQRKVGPDFQNGEWLLRRGFVDECVGTDRLAARLAELLEHAAKVGDLADLQTRSPRTWEPEETVALDG